MGKKKGFQVFGCDQCPLTYNYRCNLKRHVKKCHFPNGHSCPYCPCTYEKVAERDSHLKIHNKIISERGQATSTSSLAICDELSINFEPCFSTKTNVHKNIQHGLNFPCLDKKCSRSFPSEWGRSIHYQRSHLKLRKLKDRNTEVVPKQNAAVKKIRKKQTKSLSTTSGCVSTTNHFVEALQKSHENSTTNNIVKLVFLPKNRKSLKQQLNSLIPIGTGDNLVYQVPEPISDDDNEDEANNNNMLMGTEIEPTNNKNIDNIDEDEDLTTQETSSNPNNDDDVDDDDKVVSNMEEDEEYCPPVENDDDLNNEIQEKKKSTKRKERSTKNKKPTVQKPLLRHRKAVHNCPICNHLFTCKTTLRVHIAEHPGQKPWHCDECWFSFRHQPEIYQHKRWHHVPNGKFRCTFCTCSFDKETVFKRHMNLENLRQGGVDKIVKPAKLTKTKNKTEKKKKEKKPKKVKITKEPTEKKKRGRKKKVINFDKEQSNDNLAISTVSLKKSKIMPKSIVLPGEVFVVRRTGRKRIPKTKQEY